MNNSVCRNCGSILNGDVCDKCGYSAKKSTPFKNVITDQQAKEKIGDNVLAYLININKITKNDFKNLIIEFGYLFLDNNNTYSSLLKVIVPKKVLSPQKIFYIGIQQEKIMLLKNNFDENMFKKISQDMLVMHKVDLNSMNPKVYSMELS